MFIAAQEILRKVISYRIYLNTGAPIDSARRGEDRVGACRGAAARCFHDVEFGARCRLCGASHDAGVGKWFQIIGFQIISDPALKRGVAQGVCRAVAHRSRGGSVILRCSCSGKSVKEGAAGSVKGARAAFRNAGLVG